MKILLRPVSLLLLLVVSGGFFLPHAGSAQTATQDKIALMADALRARSAGDFVLAKEKLEALIRIAPEDQNVQRLLAAVNDDLARQRQAPPPTPYQPLPTPRPAPEPVPTPTPTPAASRAQPPAPAPVTAGPARLSARVVDSPTADFEREQAAIEEMLRRGRAQYIAGDYDSARETFATIEARSPNNAEAKYFQAEIARTLRVAGVLDRSKTKEQMLQEVAQGWQRPQIFDRERSSKRQAEDNTLEEKLNTITLPKVSFSGLPLSRVVDTLSALSEEYDPEGAGVNMVLIDPSGSDPEVNITLRGLTLARVLDFATESVGYEYDLQADAVVVRVGQGGAGSRLVTEFYPISRSTIIRLTGVGAAREGGAATTVSDPFAPTAASTVSAGGTDEEESLKNFLQRAGVPFDAIEGANLALADGQLIVTQTPRNMEKVRNILRRYTEVKQVEIEARFLEVRQGDLEELGFDWKVKTFSNGDPAFDPATGLPLLNPDGSQQRVNNGVRDAYRTSNRTLADAFSVDQQLSQIRITGENPVDVRPPAITSMIDLADSAKNLARITGVISGAEVGLVIRALERQTGNDLMSAPKVTVLSGKTAEITVAQELRYPESYGDIEAQVGRGDSSGSGSAGVAITAGTPQDFTMRNVGVEMSVTPTVEDDNSISLLLEPEVTEFEGFVEYGGTSVAIASGLTVSVPSGFFQPVFNVRRVRTEVTIWDGATVVMGGLTREQAVSVDDKVPVLGDIPILGRLFQSKGESSEKRNLLVFVTANLISPGGSPQRQQFRTVEPGSLFQNPTIVTPGGSVNRGVEGVE